LKTLSAAAFLVLVSAGVFLLCGAAHASISKESFREYYGLSQAPESLAREILSRDEFQQTLAERLVEQLRNLLYEAIKRLLSQLEKILPRMPGLKIDPEVPRAVAIWILLGFLALIAALGLWFALARFRASASRLRATATLEPDKSFGSASSRDLWDQALLTAEQARYAEALVLLFRFLVSRFHEEGLLSFHRGKTNREILESLGPAPFRDTVADLVSRFDQVRYGGGACAKADYDEFLKRCRQVSQQI